MYLVDDKYVNFYTLIIYIVNHFNEYYIYLI